MYTTITKRGFTLIEVLVVMALIAILAAIVLIAINPARQFAQAHNSQRSSNVQAILDAVGQNIIENKGIFTCDGAIYPLATSSTDIRSGAYGADIAQCIIPIYIAAMPLDPTGSTTAACVPSYMSTSTYETCYTIATDSIGRVTVRAPFAELGQTISFTR